MTRENAKRKIEMLDSYLQRVADYGESDHEAMMMAIKALSQELILDKIKDEISKIYVGYRHGYEIMADVMEIFREVEDGNDN